MGECVCVCMRVCGSIAAKLARLLACTCARARFDRGVCGVCAREPRGVCAREPRGVCAREPRGDVRGELCMGVIHFFDVIDETTCDWRDSFDVTSAFNLAKFARDNVRLCRMACVTCCEMCMAGLGGA